MDEVIEDVRKGFAGLASAIKGILCSSIGTATGGNRTRGEVPSHDSVRRVYDVDDHVC